MNIGVFVFGAIARALCAVCAQNRVRTKITVLVLCARARQCALCAFGAHLVRTIRFQYVGGKCATMGEFDAERLLRHVGDVAGMPGLFFEAAETERKLPGVLRQRYRVAWPDYAPDPGLAYGYNDVDVRPGPADAAEVWRYDQALKLARGLDADDAKLVWAVAHSAVRRRRGPAWSRVARIVGSHPQTVKRDFERAMLQMWFLLKGTK